MSQKTINVSIANQPLQLNCREEDYALLKESEKYIKQTLYKLREDSPEIRQEQLLSLGLLNLTFELLSYKSNSDRDVFIVNQSLDNIATALREMKDQIND